AFITPLPHRRVVLRPVHTSKNGRQTRSRVKTQPDSASNRTSILSYYDETWLDYRLLWLNRDNYAIHFGYWVQHTSTHSPSLLDLNAVLAERIGIRAGQRLLDAGCGVGG